ncbi:MAG TPA: amidohydrolase [Ureibacillus sp.]|nr:amidohydrolase [Ureibacillus sp.]
MTETLLFIHATVVTMNEQNDLLIDGAVFIDKGRIQDIGKTEDLLRKYQNIETLDLSGQVLMPGLINLHLHSGLTRGTAEDLEVFEWLTRHVDPKHRVLLEDDAYAAASLSYAEGVKSGTTTVLDMYRYVHRCIQAADEVGIRAVYAPYVADRPQYNYFETLETNIDLLNNYQNSCNGRVKIWVGLEHLSYCTKEAYYEAARIAEKYDTGIHTHGEESFEMSRKVKEKYGRWPIEVFYDRGILGPKTILAHCVWVEPSELEILASTKTSVAHCPVSNLKLASGIAPIHQMQSAGITVGIGTDGVKENNNLDLMEEMKYVPLLQKVKHLDATIMPAEKVLRMATIDAAKALGLDQEIGSVECGKKADLIVIDFRRLHLTPVLTEFYQNIFSNLVYAAQGSDVQHVFVDGTWVMKNRQLQRVNEETIRIQAQQHAEQLIIRRESVIPKQYSFQGEFL